MLDGITVGALLALAELGLVSLFAYVNYRLGR